MSLSFHNAFILGHFLSCMPCFQWSLSHKGEQCKVSSQIFASKQHILVNATLILMKYGWSPEATIDCHSRNLCWLMGTKSHLLQLVVLSDMFFRSLNHFVAPLGTPSLLPWSFLFELTKCRWYQRNRRTSYCSLTSTNNICITHELWATTCAGNGHIIIPWSPLHTHTGTDF